MAAIAVVYPCVLAHKIYVHNQEKGGLDVPEILMKYGHFFTGASRRPSATALYRPEIFAELNTCRLQAERLATLFLWAPKLSREPFVRTHPGRLPAVCYVTSCDCTHTHMHARTHRHTDMHAHPHARLQTCTRTQSHACTHSVAAACHAATATKRTIIFNEQNGRSTMSRSIYAPMNAAVTMFLEDASMLVIAA